MKNLFEQFTIITPTGDRPEAFALCCEYIRRQTVYPFEWLVIDDGVTPTTMPTDLPFLKYIPRENKEAPKHTLPMQMKEVLKHVTTDIVIMFEDDDWYREDYCEYMLHLLGDKDLAGLGNTVYYNIPTRRYFVHDNVRHAAWCNTVFRTKLIPNITRICEYAHRNNNPYIDLKLWRGSNNIKKTLDLSKTKKSVGIKALPGREGTCSGHTCVDKFKQDNTDAKWLKNIIGSDINHYTPFMMGDVKKELQSISVVSLVADYNKWSNNVKSSLRYQPAQLIPIPGATSAACGLNIGISYAQHDIVVCCHEDVIFTEDWVFSLLDQIKCLHDDNFGVLGTFGRDLKLNCAGNIWNPYPKRRSAGKLPCKAMSLDEHCLVIRKSSGLRFDETLPGFHIYGGDLCLQAREKGMQNYVVDACLNHLSPKGQGGPEFTNAVAWMLNKWRKRTDVKTFRTMCYEVDFETGSRIQYL